MVDNWPPSFLYIYILLTTHTTHTHTHTHTLTHSLSHTNIQSCAHAHTHKHTDTVLPVQHTLSEARELHTCILLPIWNIRILLLIWHAERGKGNGDEHIFIQICSSMMHLSIYLHMFMSICSCTINYLYIYIGSCMIFRNVHSFIYLPRPTCAHHTEPVTRMCSLTNITMLSLTRMRSLTHRTCDDKLHAC